MFNKDIKVPLQEAELVGTSSSNIYFKLAKNSGRVGRGSGNGRGQGHGRGTGYTSKPKTRTSSWAWDGVHVKAQDIEVVYYQGPIKRGAMVVMIAAGQGAMPWIRLLK